LCASAQWSFHASMSGRVVVYIWLSKQEGISLSSQVNTLQTSYLIQLVVLLCCMVVHDPLCIWEILAIVYGVMELQESCIAGYHIGSLVCHCSHLTVVLIHNTDIWPCSSLYFAATTIGYLLVALVATSIIWQHSTLQVSFKYLSSCDGNHGGISLSLIIVSVTDRNLTDYDYCSEYCVHTSLPIWCWFVYLNAYLVLLSIFDSILSCLISVWLPIQCF